MNRSFYYSKFFLLSIINRGTSNIGRKCIWSKLNTSKYSVDRLRQGLSQFCFTNSWDVFYQNMSTREKCCKQIIYNARFTYKLFLYIFFYYLYISLIHIIPRLIIGLKLRSTYIMCNMCSLLCSLLTA